MQIRGIDPGLSLSLNTRSESRLCGLSTRSSSLLGLLEELVIPNSVSLPCKGVMLRSQAQTSFTGWWFASALCVCSVRFSAIQCRGSIFLSLLLQVTSGSILHLSLLSAYNGLVKFGHLNSLLPARQFLSTLYTKLRCHLP